DQVLVATGRAGIFRSEGTAWRRSMDGLVGPNGVSPQVDFVCQSRSSPRVVYAFAGLEQEVSPFTGLFSSNDFGKTWTRRARVPGAGFPVCEVDPDDSRTVYISTLNGDFVDEVWKSTDGGRTVQRLNPSGLFLQAVTHGTLYFANDFALDKVFASTDGGATIQPLP